MKKILVSGALALSLMGCGREQETADISAAPEVTGRPAPPESPPSQAPTPVTPTVPAPGATTTLGTVADKEYLQKFNAAMDNIDGMKLGTPDLLRDPQARAATRSAAEKMVLELNVLTPPPRMVAAGFPSISSQLIEACTRIQSALNTMDQAFPANDTERIRSAGDEFLSAGKLFQSAGEAMGGAIQQLKAG
ncbi:MAG TPA: hypothetical protein VF681_16025 [Abditibacteriaceae bacterium]